MLTNYLTAFIDWCANTTPSVAHAWKQLWLEIILYNYTARNECKAIEEVQRSYQRQRNMSYNTQNYNPMYINWQEFV